MATIHIYQGTCLTNLHVGSGGNTYGLIDKEVSRDVVFNVPNIPSSGVKGALREHFKKHSKDPQKENHIFGPATRDEKEETQGAYKFLDALLYAYPLPELEKEDQSFYLATIREVQAYYKQLLESFLGTCPALPFPSESEEAFSFDLPVNARNRVGAQGTSENLWYEECVPHKSEFLFLVISDTPKDELGLDGQVVQFGGNASIGQGLIRLKELTKAGGGGYELS